MRPPEVMDTRRLKLRKLVEGDAPTVFDRWAQDPRVTRYLVWSPHTSIEEAEEHARKCVASWEAGTSFTWMMEDRKTGEAVGSIGAYPSGHTVELGYLVAPDSWGQGYMVEAIEAVSEWFLTQPTIFRIWAEVDVENRPSARVLEKASFEKEGTFRCGIMCPNLSSRPRDAFIFGRIEEPT